MRNEIVAKRRQGTIAGNARCIRRSGTIRQELRRVRSGLHDYTLDASTRQLLLKYFGERLLCKLARTVRCTARKQETPHDGRDMDEQPAALCAEVRQNRT